MTRRPVESDVLIAMWDGGSRAPLYCFHGGSGSGLVYAALARELGTDQPLYAFEAPGFDNDRTPVDSLPRLADEYAATMSEADSPFHLLGWSLGGALAFEVALRLTAAGGQVGCLFMLDSAVPQRYDVIDEREVVHHFLHDLTGGMHPLSVLADVPRDTEDTDIASWVFERIESSGVFGPEVDTQLLRRRYAVFRANVVALHSHEPSGFYPGRVVMITAAGTPAEQLDWRDRVGRLEHHALTTAHHDLLRRPAVAQVSGIVRDHLDRSVPNPSSWNRGGS